MNKKDFKITNFVFDEEQKIRLKSNSEDISKNKNFIKMMKSLSNK